MDCLGYFRITYMVLDFVFLYFCSTNIFSLRHFLLAKILSADMWPEYLTINSTVR